MSVNLFEMYRYSVNTVKHIVKFLILSVSPVLGCYSSILETDCCYDILTGIMHCYGFKYIFYPAGN